MIPARGAENKISRTRIVDPQNNSRKLNAAAKWQPQKIGPQNAPTEKSPRKNTRGAEVREK
jgi:hypothetical protein